MNGVTATKSTVMVTYQNWSLRGKCVALESNTSGLTSSYLSHPNYKCIMVGGFHAPSTGAAD